MKSYIKKHMETTKLCVESLKKLQPCMEEILKSMEKNNLTVYESKTLLSLLDEIIDKSVNITAKPVKLFYNLEKNGYVWELRNPTSNERIY